MKKLWRRGGVVTMTIAMDDSQIKTLEQIQLFLRSAKELQFKGLSRKGKYSWMEEVLNRFDYFSMGKTQILAPSRGSGLSFTA